MIHGNITSKPVTRCAALRGPRRPGFLTGFLAGFLADFLTSFLAVFLTSFLAGFLTGFLVAIIYLPLILRATAPLVHAQTLALILRHFRPLQKATI